jgi:hypothetical protein
MKKIEFDEKCPSCSGTGLYIGMAEHDGAAVVCSNCDGTGKHHFSHNYDEFEGKIENKKVIRVYEANPGIGIGNRNNCKLEDFGGMPYKDWINNKRFPNKSEMRKYTCPAWWYQSADYKKKPDWEECLVCGSFSSCKYFSTKQNCWDRFDKEHK